MFGIRVGCIEKEMRKQVRRDIIVIGGSAGAMEALRQVLHKLPANIAATLFVTLHIPSDFPSILPELLSTDAIKVRHPDNHQRFGPGDVFVAPPDFHLLVQPSRVVLSRGPRENRHRPSIDVMFRSAARAYGPRVAAVVLSGQLDDGAAGLAAVKMAGGLTIVQDPEEAIAPEMPMRAIEYAGAECVLRPAQIADLLISVASEKAAFDEQQEASTVSDDLDREVREANLEESAPKEPEGKPSAIACPDCHGVLWEVEDGKLLRYRCRVGHAYTAEALRVALSEASESSLWVALRVMEEKAALLRRLAHRSGRRMAARFSDEADGYDLHAKSIRKLLYENQALASQEREYRDSP